MGQEGGEKDEWVEKDEKKLEGTSAEHLRFEAFNGESPREEEEELRLRNTVNLEKLGPRARQHHQTLPNPPLYSAFFGWLMGA